MVIRGIHAPPSKQLANSVTKLCHGREHEGAGSDSVPIYACSGEEDVFVMVGGGGDLFICQRPDAF